VNARYDSTALDRLPEEEFNALREALGAAGLRLKTDESGRAKLSRLRSMYEPYVHSTGRNLLMTLPPWLFKDKMRDNWQAGPWDRLIQARGLAVLGQRVVVPVIEDHF
jgi:hypothetical protein